MFKALRKALLGLVVVVTALATFYYFKQPERQRALRQQTVEWREAFSRNTKEPAWVGTVVVADALEGDKLQVNTESSPGVIVRLAGVDAPEMPDRTKRNGQPLAEESRDYLASLVVNKALEMTIVGTDVAKTPLVALMADGRFINEQVVAAGFAEASGEGLGNLPAKQRHTLENAEYSAKAQKLKIWSLPNYVRPVEHRIRQQRSVRPATAMPAATNSR